MLRAAPNKLSGENRESFRDLAIFGALFFLLAAGGYFWTITWVEPIPRDATTLVVGRDFLNFWMYGRSAFTADPSRFYDLALYNSELVALLGSDYLGNNWSYPPSIMLIAVPFGQLTYMQGLLCWTILGLAIFLWVVGSHVPDRRLLIPVVLSPAAVLCFMSGQSSFVTTAMLIGIFAWMDRKPTSAGILIGLLSLKPQLGIFFPIMLIASGRWRTFSAASVTTIAIAAATAILFGPQVWVDFVQKGLPIQSLVLADPERIATPFYPTIFMNIRGTGASYGLAMTVQACFSAFAIAAVFWAYRFRKSADPQLLAALFFACSVAGIPYLLSYDVLPLTFAAVLLLATGKLDATGRRLAQLVFWLPALQLILGTLHIPGPALIAPAFAVYVLMRLRAASESREHEPPATANALRA